MRSNIACTCGSGSVPLRARPAEVGLMRLLPERTQVVDQVVELLRALLLEVHERRHRRRGVDERAGDRRLRKRRADLRQVRTRPRVAVVADAMAAEAARVRNHELAGLELRGGL